MDKHFFESVLSKLQAPERVKVLFIENQYVCILSADNTNDTFDWFHINSDLLEKELSRFWPVFEVYPSSTKKRIIQYKKLSIFRLKMNLPDSVRH